MRMCVRSKLDLCLKSLFLTTVALLFSSQVLAASYERQIFNSAAQLWHLQSLYKAWALIPAVSSGIIVLDSNYLVATPTQPDLQPADLKSYQSERQPFHLLRNERNGCVYIEHAAGTADTETNALVPADVALVSGPWPSKVMLSHLIGQHAIPITKNEAFIKNDGEDA